MLACASALLSLVPVFAIRPTSARQEVPVPRTLEDPSVAPVVGPSWLTRRGVAYDRTNLGVATRDALTRAPTDRTAAAATRDAAHACPRRRSALSTQLPGVSPRGETARPIRTLRSAANSRRCFVGGDQATTTTNVARTNLPDLIRHGTVLMPAREHLKDDDLDMLFDYLTQAADPIETARRARRVGSWARLGEHVVKGTCHICHDAVGPRTSPASVQKGEIPSLEALLAMRFPSPISSARRGPACR